ncbi:SIR2 family protein [Synergistales bacterium]|nr:SIR2 family protein [Synergistales bacterium]
MAKTRYFDPAETVRGIQQVLVSDKKKIAFLFGAGTSLAKRSNDAPYVPAVGKMTEIVEAKIAKNAKYKSVLSKIKTELIATPLGYNIETLLTNVEDKIRVIGGGELNGLKRNGFEKLAEQIKVNIREIVSIHKDLTDEQEQQLVQYDFAKWMKNADRKYAVEIFTTNYDYLIELGLEAVDVPYYDGFSGSYMPFFNSESLEDMNFLPRQTKLWKIHGSLGLHEVATDAKRKIIRKRSDSDALLIYPSSFKYSNSKKMPYAAFMDRLNDFLKQDDTVLFVCGYSFGDEHINERIISALNTNTTSHVFVLFYDIEWEDDTKKYALTPDCKLAQIALNNRRISVLGARNAIVGSVYGTWKLKREPDKEDSLNVQWFFDEDAPINDEVGINEELQGNETWTGEGELTLPNFTHFVDFLKNMIPKNEWENSANG